MSRLRRLHVAARRERRRGRRYQPRFRLNQIGVTSLAALCAVFLLGLLSLWSGQVLIVAPLGASCVLLFGYPASPLAQPRNIVLGNLVGALVSVVAVAWLHTPGSHYWSSALNSLVMKDLAIGLIKPFFFQ